MGAGHSHALEDRPRASERTSITLGAIVAAVLFLTFVGVAFTWPYEQSNVLGTIPTVDEGSRWVEVRIDEVQEDGNAVVQVLGDDPATEALLLDTGNPAFPYEVGDVVHGVLTASGDVIFADYERDTPIVILLIVYVLLVVVIARWRGVGALLGLAFAFGLVIFYTVPALFAGSHPLVVGLVTGAGALFVLLYMAHGPNARTTTAYLGTLAGLIVTAGLAWWAIHTSKLTGVWSEESSHFMFWEREVSLQGLLVCGVILAGLGVLNDVTVTQASAVWELRSARPDISRRELFARGMRIGRDHIASTVYTIAFAYAGAALPLIMLVSMYQRDVTVTLTTFEIGEEVVRTLVTSIGLVLAVPLTTLIAAVVVGRNAVVVEPATDHAAKDGLATNKAEHDHSATADTPEPAVEAAEHETASEIGEN